jgi:hypothetical protein
MKRRSTWKGEAALGRAVVAIASLVVLMSSMAIAQNPKMQDKVMAIKQAQEANKQKLAQYTWKETETISVKGDVKDTKVYQVHMGPDGKPQKDELSEEKAAQSSSGKRGGPLKKHVVEKKTEEFKEYGQQIGALAKQYTTPDPDRLMRAKQQGDISLQPGTGTASLVIKNYVKPGDSVTMMMNQQTHSPESVQVSSYLNDPKDPIKISAQFAQLPDGTNHVATTQIDGVSKQLTIKQQNSDYQKR